MKLLQVTYFGPQQEDGKGGTTELKGTFGPLDAIEAAHTASVLASREDVKSVIILDETK